MIEEKPIQLLTPKEVAQILGLKSDRFLARWRYNPEYYKQPLPYIKIGRYVRYKLSDVNAFIKSKPVFSGGQ